MFARDQWSSISLLTSEDVKHLNAAWVSLYSLIFSMRLHGHIHNCSVRAQA